MGVGLRLGTVIWNSTLNIIIYNNKQKLLHMKMVHRQTNWSHVNNRMIFVWIFSPTWPSPWTNRWPPCHCQFNYCVDYHLWAYTYIISQIPLGSFSLTHLEQHYACGTDTNELVSFALKAASPVILWVTYHVTNGIFLTNVPLRVSHIYNKFG